MNKKTKIGLGVALLISLVVGAAILQNQANKINVKTEKLKETTVHEEISTSGSLMPKEMQKVFFRPEAGEFDRILVDENEKVKKGEGILQYKSPSHRVKSNMNGRVIQVNSPNASGDFSQPVAVIATMESFVVQADVTEYDALKVKKGQSVTLKWDADPSREWTGKISRVGQLPKGSEAEGTSKQIKYDVEISPDQRIPLKLGSRLMVLIQTKQQKVKAVPQKALIRKNNKDGVFVTSNNQATWREVDLGISDGKKVEIRSGLDPEDEVIINPPQDMKNGAEVTVQ
ncbi:efflux RND transporter periplasmic adaptor subunit [Kroppenstedtia pulmonis]|uniref:Efflux RND transporter periplasmic adaptor subunit n=1 Tax=Kroppenstedtia pulmonis TaxID=1380685 RepID=A0A7D4CX44_9BACL|nr:efflux RND transporter periplasmic adaptor subunit [Kroppenstedtia pulmonis]QKG85637.1 efflux RND transporter periplasmic adaptor subunit [Kroppenstedtia pulmonis]